jgi:hypothetical protein
MTIVTTDGSPNFRIARLQALRPSLPTGAL